MSRWQGSWLIAILWLLPAVLNAQQLDRPTRAPQPIVDASEPLRLLRPETTSRSGAGSGSLSARSSGGHWTTTITMLAVVVGLIVLTGYGMRRRGAGQSGMLPEEALQILGRRFIDPRTSIQMVRCGAKILIVAHSQQHGLSTLGEISDPAEVDRLVMLCGGDPVRQPVARHDSGAVPATPADAVRAAYEVPLPRPGLMSTGVPPRNMGGGHG